MGEIRVPCDGKEYDLGYAHGCYYTAPFWAPSGFERRLAFTLGCLAGTNARLGALWNVVHFVDLVIHRLNEVPERAQSESKQTVLLMNIESHSDQRVEAYSLRLL